MERTKDNILKRLDWWTIILFLLLATAHVIGDKSTDDIDTIHNLTKQHTIVDAASLMVFTVPSDAFCHHTIVSCVFAVRVVYKVVLHQVYARFLNSRSF